MIFGPRREQLPGDLTRDHNTELQVIPYSSANVIRHIQGKRIQWRSHQMSKDWLKRVLFKEAIEVYIFKIGKVT